MAGAGRRQPLTTADGPRRLFRSGCSAVLRSSPCLTARLPRARNRNGRRVRPRRRAATPGRGGSVFAVSGPPPARCRPPVRRPQGGRPTASRDTCRRGGDRGHLPPPGRSPCHQHGLRRGHAAAASLPASVPCRNRSAGSMNCAGSGAARHCSCNLLTNLSFFRVRHADPVTCARCAPLIFHHVAENKKGLAAGQSAVTA